MGGDVSSVGMPESSESRITADVAALLRRGQAEEERGQFDAAIASYHHALEAFASHGALVEIESRRTLGLVWINLGNALQKNVTASRPQESIRAYDEAIAVFQTLPYERTPAFRNHLGAAWLNRGHALVSAGDPAAAGSFERAIEHFSQLSLDQDPSYRLNLAGAWTNLAHTLLEPDDLAVRDRSRAAARSALVVVAPVEHRHEFFAAMSLRARRALIMALGDLINAAEKSRRPVHALVAEATDTVDEGLAIARKFESRDRSPLRPLAARLFRLGAQLYGAHQPQFLGEFLLENLRHPSFGADPEFQTVARDALAATLEALQQPRLFVANFDEAEKLIATARSLRESQIRISQLLLSA